MHRDIKPDNIMFDEFGQCVLTDFGIAKAASGQKLTGTGMSIGTPHYMSPEQARAQSIDGRSDIYSLGVVAYQCLTGTVPYDGEDSFSIGYKHITEPIPTPSLDHRRRAPDLRGHQADADEGSGRPLPELRRAGGLDSGPADRGAGRGPRIGRGGRGRGRRSGAPTAPSPIGGLPPIVSQPTTPIESPLVNRRATPLERRDAPRRVADRSLAMRGATGSWAWLWLVLAVLGGGGGAFYYYKAHGFAPGIAEGPDSAAAAADTTLRDTTAARTPAISDGVETFPAGGDARAAAPAPTPATPPATPAPDSSARPRTHQRPGRGRRRQRRYPDHRDCPAARR